MSVPARRSIARELGAIGLLAAAFLVAFRTRSPYVDFALAALAVGLIVLSERRSRVLWSQRRAAPPDAVRSAWLATSAFTAAALIALIALAAFTATRGGPSLAERLGNWRVLIAIALYFPWAFLQQYIFQFYLFGRWLALVAKPVAIALTGLTFAAVHFPRWPVMAATAVAGVVWAIFYYRWRRLSPLAASHAILGAALHYWVFGNDLLMQWLAR